MTDSLGDGAGHPGTSDMGSVDVAHTFDELVEMLRATRANSWPSSRA
ncbi:hypothetical protein [Streptomyces sp. NPDC001100]